MKINTIQMNKYNVTRKKDEASLNIKRMMLNFQALAFLILNLNLIHPKVYHAARLKEDIWKIRRLFGKEL